jgi:hypothetical protein
VAIADLKSSLAAFATFARSLQGDEKSEAQSFLDHFFRALGHPSAIAAGACRPVDDGGYSPPL